jgi:23S rRNA (adenine2503-C2)-methyltransferase
MAVSTAGARKNLKDFGEAEFGSLARGLGLPDYRGRQISKWIFAKGASSFEEMTDLSKELRSRLQENYTLEELVLLSTQRSLDGTRKFLFQTPEGASLETVLIPDEGPGTLWISFSRWAGKPASASATSS